MNDTVIQCTRLGMGSTNLPALNSKLIKKYFELLLLGNDFPAVITFYTDGVQLVCEGSPILEELRQLEARGVRLIICSTCLDEMNLTHEVSVGIIGGMTDILEAQQRASKVITL